MTAARAAARDCPVRQARTLACLQSASSAISSTVCSARMRESFSFGLLLVGGRRNIVVTPARTFMMSGLIPLVLSCPLCGIVEPGVAEIVRQTALALPDLVHEGAELGPAPPTGGRGACGAKGHLLGAVTLQGEAGRMPLIHLAEGHLAALVVGLEALEDLHHRLLTLPPAVLSAGRSCRVAGSRAGS